MANHDSIQAARTFAVAVHGDQQYGDAPYSKHLDRVASLLEPYGPEAQVIGYLHDVIEDTSVTLTEIEQLFGASIAACVALVTDEPGTNRRDRKARTNLKLEQVPPDHELALVVKVADRLANVTSGLEDGREFLVEMYRRELAAFRQAVFRPGLCNDLWHRLEKKLR
ncbi:MAG: HD domain-containing protein [bacterium]